MNTMFIKSGGYYETPGLAVSGAINEIAEIYINQFNKSDNSFKFDFVNGEYRFYQAAHLPSATYTYRSFDPKVMAEAIDKYTVAYYGIVTGLRDVLTHAAMFDKLTYIGVDLKTGKFYDAITGMQLPGDNILPVLYGIKMADQIYAVYMSAMARIDTNLMDEDGEHRIVDDFTTICVNDGQAIRDLFIKISTKNVEKHFWNQDLVIGYAMYVKRNQTVELDIFKTAPYVTEEFKKSLSIEVESNLECIVENGKVVFTTPDNSMNGYLTIKLSATPLYHDVADREIKETLTFNFMLFVL